jgi:hypothetical protein
MSDAGARLEVQWSQEAGAVLLRYRVTNVGAGRLVVFDRVALRDEAVQARAIAGDERLHHLLGERFPCALQFAEDDARHARVLGHEGDMRHEHGLERRQGRGRAIGRAVDARQQLRGHPVHHRLQDRVLVRKVPEQRALREVHVLGNGRRGDLARVLRGRQRHHGPDGDGAAFVSGQVFGRSGLDGGVFHDKSE